MNSFEKFAGSCIVCLQGTDTGLAFVGSLEWKAAGLSVLGIPQPEAIAMVEGNATDDDPLFVRVCAACVGKCPAPFPVPKLIIMGAELPAIRERVGV